MSSISAGRPSPTPSFTLKNITVDDNDSSLKYSQGWARSESSSAFGGSFQSAKTVGDIVSFSLPANATAVYYFGFKQSSGAIYEACLDCPAKPTTSDVDVIDAHTNDTGSSEPTLLYQQTNLDPAVLHSLAIINAPDSRFKNESTITVDSFVVTVQNGGASSSPSNSTSSTTSTSASTSLAGASLMAMDPTSTIKISFSQTPGAEPPVPPTTLPDPSSVSAASAASASASEAANLHSQNQSALTSGQTTAQKLQPLLLTAIILVSLFVICTTLYAVMYFMRRRKRRRKAPLMVEEHWAARFFGDKKRGSVRPEAWGDSKSEAGVRVAKGAMVEQLVPDRPSYNYASQSYSQNPELSRYEARPWVQPEYASNLNAPQAPTRTVPRSAFPGQQPATAGSPPYRSQSPAYGRGPAPVSGRSPSPRMSPNRMDPNPYVAEAYARVRERAQITGNGYGYGGQPLARGNSRPGPPDPGYGYRNQQAAGGFGQVPPSAQGYGYSERYRNPEYQGPQLHRNGSWGSNYSQ